MCTLSVVTSTDLSAIRLLFNRDERRLRPLAHPLARHRVRGVSTVWPVDAASGGTWIAASDHGLAFALLNADGPRTGPGSPSRDTLIPALAGAASLAELETGWRAIDTTGFAPFRLIAVSTREIAVFARGCLEPSITPVGRAQVFCSSSLGDALVEGPRRGLLLQLLREAPDPWMAQARFHHHAWPDRRHLSVMMSRTDACTVSCTEIILAPGRVTMHYRPVVDGWPISTRTEQMRQRRRGPQRTRMPQITQMTQKLQEPQLTQKQQKPQMTQMGMGRGVW